MNGYRVRVTKDYLTFASGHFISFEDHECERLHGHNYRVGVVVEGPLGAGQYVLNFVTIKRTMKRLADELDHRVLIATHNPVIAVHEEPDGSVGVTCRDRRYRFPREDVVLLPISNTTAELLATHLSGRLHDELRKLGHTHLTALEIEVEESTGQSAFYREELTAAAARDDSGARPGA
ncbi:MAG: 6-carboxytetrahydropterin synthase [Gemmatimonadetes bacterium]|nr:6-carboxytetrahydropterin synthase [Gemmatimonadota bacterium]